MRERAMRLRRRVVPERMLQRIDLHDAVGDHVRIRRRRVRGV
jgi:hypothetical protein